MLSYTAESVFDALHVGLMGRAPDSVTRAHYVGLLEKGELDLPALVEQVLSGRERQRPYFTADQAIDAIHVAALGTLPDINIRARLAEEINSDSKSDVLSSIGAALFHSPEHQKRLLPDDVSDRVLIDHSPNGEFIEMLRLFLGANGRGLMVEVGLPTPNASYSIDFLRLSGWRGILIDSSAELQRSINARFSGIDFELIEAQVGGKVAQPSEVAWQIAKGFALAELEDVDSANGALAPILASANVPINFEILAVSRGPYTSEVINDLIATSEYRPALIIAELEPPLNWTDLSQLGLSNKMGQSYRVGLSRRRSVFLVRRW
jgi:hypothetical protein